MKYYRLIGREALLVTGAVLLVGAVQAHAAEKQQQSLEEVVVTAQRREQSLQDVPLSVTAFSGKQMQQAGIETIVGLDETLPNVTLKVSRGTNSTLTAFIRGVGQQDPVAGFESGVGLYLDDVYLNRPQAAVLDVYDVQRVEVLRGPQGTLYGRNTIGGAIKYVTKPLSDKPELKVRGDFGSYTQLDGIITASTPVTDTLKVGGSIAKLTHGGYGKNLNLGIDNYSKDVFAGRGTIEWNPAPDLLFRLTGDYTKDDSDPRQGHRLIPSTAGDPVLSNVYDTRAGLNNPKQKVTAWGMALHAKWSMNDNWTFKNILAYRWDESWSPIDFDSLPPADLDVPVEYRNKQFSEEFQAHFNGERLKGIAGMYYLKANAYDAFDVILATTGQLLNLPGLNAFTLGNVDTNTWSIFGDFTYDLSDHFSIDLGGRYTSDRRRAHVLRQTKIGGTSPLFGGTAVPIATTSDFHGAKTFTEFTPRASISWKPAPGHNIYFTYSKGFKGGGFDPRGQTTAAPDLNHDGVVDNQDIFNFMSFKPETVDSYELGYKANLFDNRLDFALDVFYANYDNVQIPGSIGFDSNGDGINDTFIGITTNAANAIIEGVEFEGRSLVGFDLVNSGDDLNFAWTLGYIHAKYKKYIDAFGNDVANQRVFQNTPKWTISGTLTYATPLQVMGKPGRISLINTVSFRSKTSQFETPNPYLDQPAYALFDASLVWEGNDGHWQVGIHGRNLTDERYIVAGYNFVNIGSNGAITPTLGLLGTLTGFYGDPRTVTGTVQYSF